MKFPNKDCKHYEPCGICRHPSHHGRGPYPCTQIYCRTDEANAEYLQHVQELQRQAETCKAEANR